MDHYDNISGLLIRYFRQELTATEAAELEAWLNDNEKNRQFFADLNEEPALMADIQRYGEEKQVDLPEAWEKMKAMGWQRPVTTPARIVQMRWRYVAAAVAVLLIVFITIFYLQRGHKPAAIPVVVKAVQQDVKPTTRHAYLTLDNGQTISLDTLSVGLLATEGTTQVQRQANGALSYAAGKNGNAQKLLYNKVTVPKGSDVVYLQLADGSKVWLNAESSIRYPVAFIEGDRKVEITGEVYFEVKTAPSNSPGGGGQSRSFIVSKGNMNVVVLGTRFNVNTYDNEENIKVTLLEGSVRVQQDKTERTIKPGQQAVVSEKNINVVDDVDVQQVMAWKEGKFVFNNTNIQVIMRQMERWYDLQKTEYGSEAVKQLAFNGAISRYNNASKVLELLQEAGALHYTIKDKRVILSQ
ncbi:FecR domain-containing protein [Longitalea luteola]|uniref:FecR domain-containing protein n=1 Tax=Longitalea luteola TaxID=2812563 RepID=UPI001A96B4CA